MEYLHAIIFQHWRGVAEDAELGRDLEAEPSTLAPVPALARNVCPLRFGNLALPLAALPLAAILVIALASPLAAVIHSLALPCLLSFVSLSVPLSLSLSLCLSLSLYLSLTLIHRAQKLL